MRKLFVFLAALSLVVAACGGDSDSGGSCELVVDDVVAAFQDVIDGFDALSAEEIGALDGSDQPQFMTDMDNKMDELQDQADDLGCSDETLEELFLARVDTLTADGVFGELMLSELQNGNPFE